MVLLARVSASKGIDQNLSRNIDSAGWVALVIASGSLVIRSQSKAGTMGAPSPTNRRYANRLSRYSASTHTDAADVVVTLATPCDSGADENSDIRPSTKVG